MAAIRAFETLDCSKKVRIHYLLPESFTEGDLELFPRSEVGIQRFSTFVAGAKDHFTITRLDRYHASGVLGENRIVVTYGKWNGVRPVAEISTFHSTLERRGWSPIQLQKAPAVLEEGLANTEPRG